MLKRLHARYMPRWRGENREHWTAYLRKRYAALPRDKLRAIAARYREKHRDETQRYSRHWRAARRHQRYRERKREDAR